MNPTFRVLAAAVCAGTGVALVAGGIVRRQPSLQAASRHLARTEAESSGRRTPLSLLVPTLRRVRFDAPVSADLRLVGRSAETHALLMVGACLAGLIAPVALLVAADRFGVLAVGAMVPLLAGLAGAVVGPLVVHTAMRGEAAAIRLDLRHQLSAYLDVVAMLLAANVGNEGALKQAAAAGDGRFFSELRRRILAAETSNRSLVHALAQLGDDLDLVELQQVAASAALGSSSGAPVAKTLAAKCASLRHALSAEQEAEARVRAGRITFPLVGMSLLIMTAVIYPALQFSP